MPKIFDQETNIYFEFEKNLCLMLLFSKCTKMQPVQLNYATSEMKFILKLVQY